MYGSDDKGHVYLPPEDIPPQMVVTETLVVAEDVDEVVNRLWGAGFLRRTCGLYEEVYEVDVWDVEVGGRRAVSTVKAMFLDDVDEEYYDDVRRADAMRTDPHRVKKRH